MKELEKLMEHTISRVNINLRHSGIDVGPYLRDMAPVDNLLKFYAFYGIWSNHPIHFHFSRSNLAGSYFLGRCKVDNSILYKCDIRGDELKEKGEKFDVDGTTLTVEDDEVIWIKNSLLIKTLVHNFSHNPEKLELFLIKNSASAPYANIHGSPVEGCFLEPFSTVDLTSLHDCRVGTYTYVNVGYLSHKEVESGRVWIKHNDDFEFNYLFDNDVLRNRYIAFEPGKGAMGMFMDFAEDRKIDFQRLYDVVNLDSPVKEIPRGASINRYSVWKGKNNISENVLVSQRAYLESASLGPGANAQENCYISFSNLAGYNVTAHGATIIYANMGKKCFVGFNSFLQGRPDCQLTTGDECIVMPHTIMDLSEPVNIPGRHLVWGYIRTQADLEENSISLERLSKIKDGIEMGNMRFTGNGEAFVNAFRHRIDHILQANGAFYDGESGRGHAQKGQNISFNIIQPYPRGPLKGLYPTIDIEP
ncbi:MAG: transferase [Desulfococcaceae bacterium]|nr:transferase [Desulfococcaceae bacterium]